MSKDSYAQRIADAELMLSGLKAGHAPLEDRGLGADFISRYESAKNAAVALNSAQETLKAELKAKTAELENVLKSMEKLHSDAKKRIKLDVPFELWKKFGIQDSK